MRYDSGIFPRIYTIYFATFNCASYTSSFWGIPRRDDYATYFQPAFTKPYCHNKNSLVRYNPELYYHRPKENFTDKKREAVNSRVCRRQCQRKSYKKYQSRSGRYITQSPKWNLSKK